MTRPTPLRRLLCFGLVGLATALLPSSPVSAAETGYQEEVKVKKPTRLDWKFAAGAFGSEAAVVPKEYDSKKQRYQLFVPKKYKDKKAWPLVVYISPGNESEGWKYWKKPCTKLGMLYCSPHQAGNKVPVGQRTRIVLDVLDDVRRRYKIDPNQTYLAGFSGGGRMACPIACALPEYFGGLIPICGTNLAIRLPYLMHRVQDRLSVAFVTGEKDFNRKETEKFIGPYFKDLKVRSKIWVVDQMGHGVPSPEVLTAVLTWLGKDLERRRTEAEEHPGLAVAPKKTPTPEQQAKGLLKSAKAELKSKKNTWRGIALLQGVVIRWKETEPADEAQDMLEDLQADPKKVKLFQKQKGDEDRSTLVAQARALEKFGYKGRPYVLWQGIAKRFPDTPEGKKAVKEAERLKKEIDALPKKAFIGVMFQGMTLKIGTLVKDGPAHKAGIKPGDTIIKLGGVKVTKLEELSKALDKYKPGDKAKVTVEREGKPETIEVKLGIKPVD